ncbi:MAG: M48 family metallopeptidase [Candidatus Paceibacterota bacterium]|jgi:hypothetical protein
MEKNIELHKRKVPYTIKVSSRAKRLRLAVYCDGAFVVTTPKHISQGLIEKFIIQRSRWILDKIDYFNSFSSKFKKRNSKEDFIKYKKSAQKLAEDRVVEFNKIYNFKINKINIKNQKTRWGSCSRKGNLNFNYKIALLPEKLSDYIIVHEICHLGEFNHSRRFWNLVSKAVPNYPEIRGELRKQGLVL